MKDTIEGAGSGGERATAVVCDIRSPQDRGRLVDVALEQSGTLFGLVNNAGIGRLRPLFDETAQEWQAMLNTSSAASSGVSRIAAPPTLVPSVTPLVPGAAT